MTGSNLRGYRRGVLATFVVLALLAGVVSEVAADSEGEYENDTNTTYFVANETNVTTATNDTVATVGSAANVTNDPVVDGDTDTDEAVDEPRSVVNTPDVSVDGPDGLDGLLSKPPSIGVGPGGAGPPLGQLIRSESDDSGDRGASRNSDGESLSHRQLASVRTPAPPSGDAAGEGAAHAGDGPAIGESGDSTSGGDVPDPVTGFAVGLPVAVAGVAYRELTDLPAPARTAALTGRRMADSVPRLFAPLRYSRYDDSDPLEHEDRETVFETIDDSPGVYLSELSEQTGVSLSTLRHHVRVLERENLIAAARVRGRRRFYPAHTEDVELAAAMNDEATAPIVDALARLGAVTVSDLADVDGRDASTVTHHLQRLEEDGLVEREREGRAIVNRLAAEVQEALAPLGETAADRPESEHALSAD